MKTSISLLLLCGALALSASAQPLIQPDEAREANEWADQLEKNRKENAGSKKVEPDSGFYWLLRAGESLGDNHAPMPRIHDEMTPWNRQSAAQKLPYHRAFAAYYAESLKLLRVALQKDIARPIIDGKPFDTGLFGSNYNYNAGFRQLARALDSLSSARAAGGDFAGAMDSCLDCFALGVATSNGALTDMLTGSAIESIGRGKISEVAARLSAAQCRAAAARLRQIEARRPAYSAILRWEAEEAYNFNWPQIQDEEFRRAILTPEGRKSMGGGDGEGASKYGEPTEAQAREILALTLVTLRQNIDRFYGAAIENAVLPYSIARKTTKFLPRDVDYLTAIATGLLENPAGRLVYERNRTQQLLLEAALELHALKLETGAYPATFEAGIDPLSDEKPLIYRRAGQIYQLYSVGPNGIDDGGASLQTIETDEKTGAKTRSERVRPDSNGDILALVL